MGAYQSRRRDFPATKNRKLRKPVFEYLPNSSRRRPKSSHSWREVVMVTMGQMDRSATSLDGFDTEIEKMKHLPKWQSKWEVEMRPAPTSENRPNLRSLAITTIAPTTAEDPGASKPAPNSKTGINGRRGRRRNSRTRRFESRRVSSPLPEVEETDNIERFSWRSSKVDGLKMLHKSEDKTLSTLQQASQMWQLDKKRTTKTWFLGQDSHNKMENQIVEKKAHAVKTRKVFVVNKANG